MKIITQNFGEVILLTSPMLAGATESIAFKTDVFESKNGTENRTPLKDKARQSLSFSHNALRNEIAQNFNVQWGGIRKNWAIPLAQESQFVGDISADFVMCRTDIYSFYDGCLALLKNDSEQILVEVESVELDRLTLAETVNITNAKLYPVRICFIRGDISRQINSQLANSSITFNVIDETEIEMTSSRIVFVLDDSGSMSTANMSNMKAGVTAILDNLAGEGHSVMIQAMNSGHLTYQNFDENSNVLAKQFVNGLIASGGTSAVDSYENINAFFNGDYENGIVVTLSDGAMSDVLEAKEMIQEAFEIVKFMGLGMGTVGSLNEFDNTGNPVQVVDADGIVTALNFLFSEFQTKFKGHDLYFFCLTYSGDSLDASLSQQQNLIDNEVGVVFQNSDWNFVRYSKQYREVIKGQDQLYEYRKFLFRRKGKYRPFWLPTYEANMRCKSTGLISSTMLIESDQYKQLSDRKHVAIKSNGDWTAHTITASTITSATTTEITITPALNKNAESIQLISYLGLHRLDADSVDLHYLGAGVVEANVPILEIGV